MEPFEKRTIVSDAQSYYEFLGAFRKACERSYGVFIENTDSLRPEYVCMYVDPDGKGSWKGGV